MKNQATKEDKRQEYMDHKITHDDYYLWLADFIGANKSHLPISIKCIEKSTDPHLNNIPLHLWDKQDSVIRLLAYAKKLAWSLSDTVCVLKAIARKEVSRSNIF